MMLIVLAGLLGASGGLYLSPSDYLVVNLLVAMFAGSAAGFLAGFAIAARGMPAQIKPEVSANSLSGLASS